MSNKEYFQVNLRNVPRKQEDPLTGLCFQYGASGVAEELGFAQRDSEYTPEILESDTVSLQVYFETPPHEKMLEELKLRFPNIEIQVESHEEKDWLEEWKKGFEAFSLAGDYWVVPSWLTPPSEAKKVIWMDPGMAFGTGTHETTQLASEILADHATGKFANCHSCLDVGTGTGILAMIARWEFAERVLTTEIDDEARPVARSNFAKNKILDIELPDFQIEKVSEDFNLVIANIIDGVLLKLKQELIQKTKPGGFLILTGILQERDSAFISQFLEASSLEVLERREKREWVGYLLRKS